MADKFFVAHAPHMRKNESIAGIMWRVNLALIPSGLVALFIFGPSALWVVLSSVLAAAGTEALIQKARGQKVTVCDGSAFMTGLLLAYNLPAHCPLWVAAVGSIFAIAIAKQAFGGLGRNIFNPALAGRAFLMAAWPKYMTTFTKPFVYDAVTQATPLSLIKEGKASGVVDLGLSYWDLLIGNRGGALGEVCILALLLGGVYLLYKGIISWHTPVSYVATVAVFMWAFGSPDGFGRGDALFQVLSGGLVLGAFFMATDYVTSPVTKKGQVIFGVCCGLLTGVIRRWGGYPEGVCYSILIMNAAAPLIDRFVQKRRYGASR
ncbi:electron transport complex protein RnfD [Candidatus Velamenicoccus archaeovorus]|uniref:Ion-translocating oxidoreductase complex subunit D n=1 Tax=Velamenicoccus archaeovorus TaxID=1930593 RepID=A0A410P6K8_VELA1|nr:RnfABCDGE type electron transport complex subunit D [Candidatus Velamenicoccus archaeovorus]QAT17584.1 electron transport complex protein RnfD [Candidatus Velamenicoccus archaeovorus]